MAIPVETKTTVRELIAAAKAANVRRLLLAEYATVEPKKLDKAFILAGMITVVATAIDTKRKKILRWFEQEESKKTVTITAGTGRGRNPGGKVSGRRQEIFDVLREEGFEVDDGEWTPASAEQFLSARKKIIG